MDSKIYIVEDQGITRAAIRSMLENAGYTISGDAATAEKAWLELQHLETDLVLIDFNLKGAKNGLWLAEKINSVLKTPFIYLTAYGSDEFLKKIMRTRPAGYIMKPYNKPTLISNVEIVLKKNIKPKEPKNDQKFEFIKTRAGLIKISEMELLFLQSDKNYVKLHLVEGQFETRDKLDDVLERLNFECLYRVHRRYAVNFKHVSKIDNDCIFIDKKCIPTSRSYEAEKLKNICLKKN